MAHFQDEWARSVGLRDYADYLEWVKWEFRWRRAIWAISDCAFLMSAASLGPEFLEKANELLEYREMN